jgi:hypothetical protein
MSVVEVEGVKFEVIKRPPTVGSLFVGVRNNTHELLSAAFIDEKNKWVISDKGGFPYEFNECLRIISIID